MEKIKSIEDLFKKAGGSIHVAAALNVHQQTVVRWLKTGIPGHNWGNLAKIYGITPNELFAISEKAKQENGK